MPLTLYDATVPSMLQILGSVERLIGKAEQVCTDQGLPPEALIDARLIADMLPFGYQIKSCAVHSIGAIEGVRRGTFSPDMTRWPDSFAGLAARIAETVAALQAIDPAEVEGFIGQPMAFVMGEYRMDFTADQFLLSFSQPNFYFHATTAYNLLRMKGVPIGKRDFNGRVRKIG